MNSNFTLNAKVRLRSFNGATETPIDCREDENFWKLIGKTGQIVALKNDRDRFLVKFDFSVEGFGLHCHNQIENSLLIHASDLECLQ